MNRSSRVRVRTHTCSNIKYLRSDKLKVCSPCLRRDTMLSPQNAIKCNKGKRREQLNILLLQIAATGNGEDFFPSLIFAYFSPSFLESYALHFCDICRVSTLAKEREREREKVCLLNSFLSSKQWNTFPIGCVWPSRNTKRIHLLPRDFHRRKYPLQRDAIFNF